MKEYAVSFGMAENSDKNGTVEFLVGGNNVGIYLDDIFLKNEAVQYLGDKVVFPLKNGDFSQNLMGWDLWSAVGATSKVEDGKVVILNQLVMILLN